MEGSWNRVCISVSVPNEGLPELIVVVSKVLLVRFQHIGSL